MVCRTSNSLVLLFLPLVLAGCSAIMSATFAIDRPHVLFIVIDDQNDWIGCLNGHPLVKTPHIDQLASRGTLFANAHCQAPLCNPSRTSLMLSQRPSTTGIYGLAPSFRMLPQWSERIALPQHFHVHGYRTYATGKIYHGGHGKGEFDVPGPGSGIGVKPEQKLIPPTPMGNHPLMDWGTFPHEDEQKGEYQMTTWAAEQLRNRPHDESMFLAVGYFLPHVPCYATQKWFDLYPDDDTVLPTVRIDDREDTPRFSWYLHWNLPEPRLSWVRAANQWRNLVRSYLACTSFVDSQVGRLLDAVEEAGMTDNTVVVLLSDHGWHLGEKAITGKNSLWERSTRVPLIFAGPGIKPNSVCHQSAELLDIYPTLSDLCGLPTRNGLEGHSLLPQLSNPDQPRKWPAITTHNQGNHGVRSEKWRYIHYADGSEELYDMEADPNEWTNLAGTSAVKEILGEHQRWLPKIDVPPASNSAPRILTYDATTGQTVWEGKPIQLSDEIPQ